MISDMAAPRKQLELKEPIQTEPDGAGGWVARLPILDIEETADSHEAAQLAAFHALLAKLSAMGESESRRWIEANCRLPAD